MTETTQHSPVQAGLPKRVSLRPEVKARLRARHRANARYRSYGLAALLIASLFLVVLIADIVLKGLPAFTAHRLMLDVPLKAEVIDPEGKRDRSTLLAADYMALVREALAATMPAVEGRIAKKQLNDLLSSGAADDLRDMVAGNLNLIGSAVAVPVLLSDTADLYFKGDGTAVVEGPAARGIATPSGTAGEITILSSSNDFSEQLVAAKKALLARAVAIRAEAQRHGKLKYEGALERVAELEKSAVELEQRGSAPSDEEGLDASLPSMLVALNGGLVKITKFGNSSATGDVLIPLSSAGESKPGSWRFMTYTTPEANRNVSDRSVAYLEQLKSSGKVDRAFNWRFFTAGDSREPELAGIRGAVVGSILTLLVTMVTCLPIGVLAAIYLEKFAPKNRFTDLIEININNLAAVPSIVFGLLGLAVFLNFFGMPRSAPLVGGLVLALLVLPTIIITTRAALRAVPPSIEEAALGVGASKQQAIFHHVLPLAMPGIMTGTIIGMAHALGETAPLLMIGMVAFIVDVPESLTESATALPVQIYLWSDLPEPAFQAKTAAAIMVLLAVLFVMNGTAIWLRKKFERRW